MKKKIVSAIIALAMGASMIPTAVMVEANSETEEASMQAFIENAFYSEDFEQDVTSDIKAGLNGWTYVPVNSSGNNDNLGYGDFSGNGNKGIRLCTIGFGISNSITVDLKANAAAKGMAGADFDNAVSGKTAVSFQFGADYNASNLNDMWDGGISRAEIQDADGNAFMAIEAYTPDKTNQSTMTMNLIALNDSKTENIRYSFGTTGYGIFKKEYDIQVFIDSDNNTYMITVGGEPLSIGDFGEWIPMSTSGEVGAASQRTSAAAPSKFKISNIGTGYWSGIFLNNIELAGWKKLTYTDEASAPEKAMSLWYRMPAEKWAQSLPLGNGRIGAMVWGGVVSDTLSLSEVTAWSGEDHRSKNLDLDGSADNWSALNNLREEMKKSNPDRSKVTQYLSAMGGTSNNGFGTNRPFGKLEFNFSGMDDAVSGYRRSLDLENAVSTVEFTSGGTKYTREAIVSNPDQIIALKYSADKAGKISFDVNFATEKTNGGTGTVTAGDDYLEWDGAVYNNSNITNGVKTFAYMQAIPTNGTVTYNTDGMHVTDADEVIVIVSLGTDFKANENYVQNTKENCKAQLDAAVTKGYDDIKSDHTADVSEMFNRMTVEIGSQDKLKSDEPTDVRFEKIKNGGEIDGSFMSLWYQYARYLMIAGSRENSPLPMNLLGIWNDNVACNMAWTCDYHIDMNTQMNQWMSNSANLSEGEIPIFNFMKNILIPSGQVTAQKQYNSEGWVAGIATNAWGYSGISSDSWEAFTDTACGAWLAQEIMNYYSHTGDKDFLKDSGFYMLKETAKFYNSFMTEYTADDGNTYWVTIPSGSPENGYVEIMSTYDITIIRDIFEQMLKCYDILDGENYIDGDGTSAAVSKTDGYYEAIKAKYDGLPDYKITEAGTIAEWPFLKNASEKGMIDDGNTNHRHTSHLLGLFPYAQITTDKTPELAAAALESMQRRFDRSDYEHTEWTAVNASGQYARLKDGENAYKYLKLEADTFTWPNLLSVSPEGIALAPCDVYCIDGTLGIAQNLAEMLLQSHSNRLEFLPALPKQWSEGNIEGMSAEGAFDVDFTWKDYTIESAVIHSKAGNKVNILKNAAINWDNVAVYDEEGNTVTVENTSKLLSFDTETGKTYTLKNKYGEKLQTGRIINDSDPRIKYTNFNYHNDRSLPDIGNDIHYSQTSGATVEFQFTGTGIDVIAEGSSGSKQMEVFIDGESKGKYSAQSDTVRGQKVLYSIENLDFGNHTIKLVQAEDGGYFEFDAFAVRGQYSNFINDDNPMITYGSGWSRSEGRGTSNFDYLGDVHYATDNGSSLTVEFEGTGIETVLEKNSGNVKIEVDGVSYGEINVGDIPNASADRRLTVSEVSGLSNGKHTLTLTKTDGDWCIVDGFVLLNEGGATITTGTYELTGLDSGKILSADGGSIKANDSKSGADYQRWIVSYINDRQFRLVNVHSGMALSLNGDYLVQKPADPTDESQVWEKVDYNTANGNFWLFSEMKGSYANVYGGNCNDGDNIGLWSNGGTPDAGENNFWSIEDSGDGTVLLKSAKDKSPAAYMTVDPNNAEVSGASIKTYAKRSGAEQVWTISFAGDGKYTLMCEQNGKYAAKVNNSLVFVDSADNDSAKWTLEQSKQNGTLYSIFTNAADGNTIDIGGEKWGMTPVSASDTAPYVYDITAGGKVSPGETINVSYNYSGNTNEGATKFRVYTVSSGITLFSESDSTIKEGTANASDGFSFTVPEDYSTDETIIIAVTPVSSDNITGGTFYKYIQPVKPQDRGLSANIRDEVVFDLDDIKNQKGYTASGEDYKADVCDKEGKENCLSVTANSWFKDDYVRLDLTSSDNDYSELTDKAYVEFNALFEAPNNYDKESRMYVALKDDDKVFASVRLFSRRLDIMALDSKGNYRKNYSIAIGADETAGKWFNFKFYVDTENQCFAVKVNDEFVTKDGKDIWFTPAAGSIEGYPGSDLKSSASKVSAIEIGHKWSGAPSSVYMSDLKLGTYGQSSGNSWIVDSFDTVGDTLEYGAKNQMNLTVVQEQPVENGKIYAALYKNGALVSIKTLEDITFDARGVYEDTITMDVPKVGGEYTAKVFLWDEDMRPIGSVYEKKFNVESAFTIPNVFSDNMMLQADEPVTVWGTASSGDEVTAELTESTGRNGAAVSAAADNEGNWSLTLPAQEASMNGESYTLTVKCGDETKTYTNIIFGDVYLLAGQSNMEAWMSWIDSANIESEKTNAENTNIRTVDLLNKGTDGESDPSENLPKTDGSEWKPMTYANAQTTSAIGYYFAQKLNEDTGRPIGYIHAAVGGTAIDRWLENNYIEGVSSPWSLYNNRVYPLRKLKLSGVLYYQGEADEHRTADNYSTIMAGLIDNYRELFDDENLPFYYAQLARYSNQNFENIRAAQVWALDKVTNKNYVRMVSNLDEVGNFGKEGDTSGNARHDIHPYGKKEVGRRFALLAEHDIYGDETTPFTGPVYKSMEVSGGSIILTFDATGDLAVMPKEQYADYQTDELISGGKLDDTILNGFEIAGEDGVYYTANAVISGNTVTLTSDEVTSPVKARYAFGAYPESPNLTDDSGLPSYTFATEYTAKN